MYWPAVMIAIALGHLGQVLTTVQDCTSETYLARNAAYECFKMEKSVGFKLKGNDTWSVGLYLKINSSRLLQINTSLSGNTTMKLLDDDDDDSSKLMCSNCTINQSEVFTPGVFTHFRLKPAKKAGIVLEWYRDNTTNVRKVTFPINEGFIFKDKSKLSIQPIAFTDGVYLRTNCFKGNTLEALQFSCILFCRNLYMLNTYTVEICTEDSIYSLLLFFSPLIGSLVLLME
ncbi:uncharacterized protein LOC121874819 [Homarus americanus]|uniref:uncharacterized protein LOC121874819 n=1 Tax=Homarus americanus TaxID=6706 RepID=UPI001C46A270|nr:uncharacterized protein LOC121874819 [Homarus americanus]